MQRWRRRSPERDVSPTSFPTDQRAMRGPSVARDRCAHDDSGTSMPGCVPTLRRWRCRRVAAPGSRRAPMGRRSGVDRAPPGRTHIARRSDTRKRGWPVAGHPVRSDKLAGKRVQRTVVPVWERGSAMDRAAATDSSSSRGAVTPSAHAAKASSARKPPHRKRDTTDGDDGSSVATAMRRACQNTSYSFFGRRRKDRLL